MEQGGGSVHDVDVESLQHGRRLESGKLKVSGNQPVSTHRQRPQESIPFQWWSAVSSSAVHWQIGKCDEVASTRPTVTALAPGARVHAAPCPHLLQREFAFDNFNISWVVTVSAASSWKINVSSVPGALLTFMWFFFICLNVFTLFYTCSWPI